MPQRTLPPHDLNAERGLLAGLFTHPDTLDTILASVAPSDLYHPLHQRILEAAATIHNRGAPVDLVVIAAQLNTDGHPSTLADLHEILSAPVGNLTNNTHLIHTTKTLRSRIACAQEILDASYRGVINPDHDHALAAAAPPTTRWWVEPPS